MTLIAVLAAAAALWLAHGLGGRWKLAAVAAVAAALGLYGLQGNPGLPDGRYDPAKSLEAQRNILEERAAELALRLQENPADRDAWKEAGRVHAAMRDYARAEAAFRGGLILSPGDPALLSALGEVMVMKAGGQVPQEAIRIFQKVIIKEKDAASYYYLGLAELQAGREQQALQRWQALDRFADPAAPWYPAFQRAYKKLSGS